LAAGANQGRHDIKILVIGVLLLALSSCSSARSPEELKVLVDLARVTGSLQATMFDPSYGSQFVWCSNRADDYIASVMGFDGGKRSDDMGEVSSAYFTACMGR